jgi:HAMP domain-containing protein
MLVATALLALVADDPTTAAKARQIAASSLAGTEAGERRIDAVRADFDQLLAAGRRASAREQVSAETAARRARVGAAIGIGGSIALIALYATYLLRAIVRPVRRAVLMAGRLAGDDLSARMPETGAGEVGALERAFNVMGGSLERSRDELATLADEQAALRRVATLVSRAASPDEVFAAVVGGRSGGCFPSMSRSWPDTTPTESSRPNWTRTGEAVPIGYRASLGGRNIATLVFEAPRARRRPANLGPRRRRRRRRLHPRHRSRRSQGSRGGASAGGSRWTVRVEPGRPSTWSFRSPRAAAAPDGGAAAARLAGVVVAVVEVEPAVAAAMPDQAPEAPEQRARAGAGGAGRRIVALVVPAEAGAAAQCDGVDVRHDGFLRWLLG